MKLGLGLYRSLLTADNLAFASGPTTRGWSITCNQELFVDDGNFDMRRTEPRRHSVCAQLFTCVPINGDTLMNFLCA